MEVKKKSLLIGFFNREGFFSLMSIHGGSHESVVLQVKITGNRKLWYENIGIQPSDDLKKKGSFFFIFGT